MSLSRSPWSWHRVGSHRLNSHNDSRLLFLLDAVCGDGDTTDINVVINDGDTFKYKTSQRGKYKDNMHCLVNYELGESCAEMKLTCKKINIKNNKDCDNGDTLIITNDEEEKM